MQLPYFLHCGFPPSENERLQTIRHVLCFTPPRFSTNQMSSSIFSGKNLIHAMRLLSLFDTLDMSLHAQHVSNTEVIGFLKYCNLFYQCLIFYSVRSEQEMTLYVFLTVKDVFVNLPTGSEKLIIYQLAQLLSLHLKELSPNSGLGLKSDATHVVVSPLISLMFFAHSLHSNVLK